MEFTTFKHDVIKNTEKLYNSQVRLLQRFMNMKKMKTVSLADYFGCAFSNIPNRSYGFFEK